ncbi:hypothetical protein MXB_702, partial [Myxobolus squamalis]
ISSNDPGQYYDINPSKIKVRLLNEQILSINADIPEAALDAAVQSAVCDQVQHQNYYNKMQWSNDPHVLKSLVVFTDQISKMQFDGK